ncbi:MAG: TA system VapC family ribonuclease toxin [bacterium]|nr:PIN domain-containing protein [Gammaproteobacteria bacterium]HIL94307.1 PIN domain-containing protein [Pseudomonadales bacterium]
METSGYRALLDVNVLIALLDEDHVHHAVAWSWFENNLLSGWATCPITQIGCVRIMSQPGYPNHLRSADVAHHLRAATNAPQHEFWPDTLSVLDHQKINWESVISPKQLTDIYLLTLAVKNKGRLVTFDQKITPMLVHGADDQHYEVI